MMDFETLEVLFEDIKKDFCGLLNFKKHGNTLEIITSSVTLTDKFVSIFLSYKNGIFYITDGGWVFDNIYEINAEHNNRDIVSLVLSQYKEHYCISERKINNRNFYYKSTDKSILVSSYIFDLSNFITGAINAYSLSYTSTKEIEERDKFRSETNLFFKVNFGKHFSSNKEVISGIKFNGVLTINSKVHLFEYITGSTQHYFEDNLKRAIVNFSLIDKYSNRLELIGNRIAIINDDSIGFQKSGPPKILLKELSIHTSKDFVKRSKIETIKNLILI